MMRPGNETAAPPTMSDDKYIQWLEAKIERLQNQLQTERQERKAVIDEALTSEVERLQDTVNLLPKIGGTPMIPSVDPGNGTAERWDWRVIAKHLREAAEALRPQNEPLPLIPDPYDDPVR